MFKSELETLSDSLDEHILKALRPRKVSRVAKAEQEIAKSLSHNPWHPHEMNADSPYYSPYQMTSDGGYMPFPVEYWEQQGKSQEGYMTTTKMYEQLKGFNKSMKALRGLASAAGDDIRKAGAVPIGTVHTYRDGKKYQKIDENRWGPVVAEKKKVKDLISSDDPKHQKVAHDTIESHAHHTGRLKEHLKKKTEAEEFKNTTVKETMTQVRKILGKLFDGPMPKNIEKQIEGAIKPEPKESE